MCGWVGGWVCLSVCLSVCYHSSVDIINFYGPSKVLSLRLFWSFNLINVYIATHGLPATYIPDSVCIEHGRIIHFSAFTSLLLKFQLITCG